MKIDKNSYEDGRIFEQSGAKWIGRPGVKGNESAPAPLMRKKITLHGNIKEATLYVTGLGQYEGFVNGAPLDERIVFAPAISDYEKRVYYNKYNVINKLNDGENTLLFVLGRGRYAFNTAGTPWNGETACWIDAVKMIAVLEITYEAGNIEVIVTDESWQTKVSGIVQDCMYMGETFDARTHAPESDEDWENCMLVKAPGGKLEYDYSEPIAITERVAPVSCTKVKDGVFVYEFTPYITGWIELYIDCPCDTVVSVQYAERLGENGEVVLEHCITPNGRLQKDFFISAGKPITYRPAFSYKGFHYVQVEGVQSLTVSNAVGCFFHNDIKSVSTLSCSNELVEWVHNAFRRTVLCNFHSLSTDTPVFEKHGWSGDAGTISPAILSNFDAHKFYRKWLNDFRDSQLETGEISVIIPTPGWGVTGRTDWDDVCGPVPAWDECYPELVYELYWRYNDKDVLDEHYESLKKYSVYIKDWTKGDLCKKGLGDWIPPTGDPNSHSQMAPEGPQLFESAYHVRIFELMEKIAKAIGKNDDASEYAIEHKRLIDLFNATYFDQSRGYYCTEEYTDFRQVSNVMPLAFGIATPEIKESVLEVLLDDLKKRDYHLNTGIFSARFLLDVLTKSGYHDTAYKVFMAKGYPGYDYFRQQGATTFPESFEYEGCRSHCHYAIGSVDIWIIEQLLGIHQLSPGYKRISIEPNLPEDIDFASYSLDTVSGTIFVKYERKGDKLAKDIVVSDGIEIEYEA